jgi:hypothetical protein
MLNRKLFAVATVAGALSAAGFGAAGASGAMVLTIKGFLPDARLHAGGHSVQVTGFVDCFPVGEHYVVHANVIQGDVIASRTLRGVCQEGPEEWTTFLHTRRGERLHAGHAEACGDAFSFIPGRGTTDSIEWCKDGGLTLG